MRGAFLHAGINQLTGRGIPVIREFARQFGVAESEVRGLVESGQIGFANLEQAIASMTGEGGQFAGMMERQSKSMKGLASTLADAWGETQTQIGEAISGGVDGKSLLQDIAGEVEELKPALVDLGVVLARAFADAIPVMKESAEWMKTILGWVSGQPTPGAKDLGQASVEKSPVIDAMKPTDEDFETAKEMWETYVSVINSGRKAMNEAIQTPQLSTAFETNAPGLKDRDKKLADEVARSAGSLNGAADLIDRMNADLRSGKGVDQKLFEELKERLKTASQLAGEAQSIVNQGSSAIAGAGLVSDDNRNAFQQVDQELSRRMRSLGGKTRAMENRVRESKREEDALASALAEAEAAGAANEAGASGASPARPGVTSKAVEDFGAALDKQAAKTEADYRKHMESIASIEFDAETKRLARTMSESDQKLFLFDRETEKRLASIDAIDQREAEAAKRAEERIDLLADAERDAADKAKKEKEKKEKEEQDLTRSIQRELRSRLAGALGDAGDLRGADRAAYYAGLANAGGDLTGQAAQVAAGAGGDLTGRAAQAAAAVGGGGGAGAAESPQLAALDQKLGGIYERLDRFKELAGDIGKLVQLMSRQPQTVRI